MNLLAGLLGLVSLAPFSNGGGVRATIELGSQVADQMLADLDGDGRSEIVVVERGGRVRILAYDPRTKTIAERPTRLTLPQPKYSALALADMLGDSSLELIVLDRGGVAAYEIDDQGVFAEQATVLTRAGRIGLRVGKPTFADYVRDLNRDGALDLIVPVGEVSQLYLNRGKSDGTNGTSAPRFELTQSIPNELRVSRRIRNERLSRPMRNHIEVPKLDLVDVNGDGKPDLAARNENVREFFLQQEDGRFAKKPIRVDIGIFRDTTPKARIGLGDTAVLTDRQMMHSGDLNGDSIPDYVIAHRRKVWSFLATKSGPQFTKASTRMVAEDVSGLLLLHLDDDNRKDLLIFKVEVPTAAELLLGLVGSIDISVGVLGYKTDPDGTFQRKAKWRRELTLRIPSLTKLLSEAENLAERFLEVLNKFRWSTLGDFDGDGTNDLAVVTEAEDAIELWRAPKSHAMPERAAENWLREILFENPNTIFDIDRILKLAAQVFDSRTATMTGDRAADARVDLPGRKGRFILRLEAADLDGDHKAEVILVDASEDRPDDLRITVVGWQ